MANEDDAAFIRTRRSVVFSFWCVILLGVPLWYRTTQVFRASLPNLLSTPTLRAGDLAILLDINDTNLDQVRLIAELNNEMAPLSFKLAGDCMVSHSIPYSYITRYTPGISPVYDIYRAREWGSCTIRSSTSATYSPIY